MKFIGQYPGSPNWQANVLTDGQFGCTYGEMQAIFAGLHDYFAQRDIGTGDCLALACENSLPCALVLLYLLEGGYSFLLVPKATNVDPSAEDRAPSFCRYRLTTSTLPTGQVVLSNPEQFLQIGENEVCNGATSNGIPHLYLRTSGSTGTPKQAAYTHTALRGNILNCVERLQLRGTDRIAIPVPISHMFGLGAAFLPGVAAGAAIDLQKGANLLRYLEHEREFVPNVAFMTPTFGETLLKGRLAPRTYRVTVMAGDRIREHVFDRYEHLFGCLVQLYGSTELGAVAVSSPGDPRELREHTVGKPLANVQLRLEHVEATEQPGIGELWCKHANGFAGYAGANGVPTGQTDRDVWFPTQDLGRILPDGRLQVLGRADHSVKRSGLLVLFADVEKAMATIPGIETVAVVPRGEGRYGKRLVAFCVPAPGASLTATDIRAACFARLVKRAIPETVVVIKALPLLPNGKVDRQTLISLAGET